MISYGPKTEEFVNLIGNKGYTINPENLKKDTFQKLFEDLEKNYAFLQANMIERYKTIRADLITKLRLL